MNNKLLRNILIGTVSIITTLVVGLCVHIYLSIPDFSELPKVQLARIDFQQPIDSTEATKVKSLVSKMKGIDGVYFNVPDGVLIYSYYFEQQNAQNVYNQVVNVGKYKAQRFIVDKKLAGGGCPVMKDGSFSYQAVVFFKNLF